MSWNISFVGRPENIVKALEEESTRQEGQSKVEFDSAKDSLIGLVKNNFTTDGEQPVLKLEAAGHGYTVDGVQKQRSLTVSLQTHYGKLV